jgi:hypothetical protein
MTTMKSWIGLTVQVLSVLGMVRTMDSATPASAPPAPVRVTPTPLYRDPVSDGSADPVLVWDPQRKAWWMYYTQRRAKFNLRGVAWAPGSEIGVAESRDAGMTWNYVGLLPLPHPDSGYSFWAPDTILDKPGQRNDDAAVGQHADVVVSGDRAYVIYFTHPYGQDFPKKEGVLALASRRSSLQPAELEVRDGKLLCDRDKPFRIQLMPPEKPAPARKGEK